MVSSIVGIVEALLGATIVVAMLERIHVIDRGGARMTYKLYGTMLFGAVFGIVAHAVG